MRYCVLGCMLACWAPFCSHELISYHCQIACHISAPQGEHVQIFNMMHKVGKRFYSVPVNQNASNWVVPELCT